MSLLLCPCCHVPKTRSKSRPLESSLMLFLTFPNVERVLLNIRVRFYCLNFEDENESARLVDRTRRLRDPIPVSAIKRKLPFTYSTGLINYTLSCAFIKAQWNIGSKLRGVPVSLCKSSLIIDTCFATWQREGWLDMNRNHTIDFMDAHLTCHVCAHTPPKSCRRLHLTSDSPAESG